MPIYEYRCKSCGFQKEHIQKMSDALLSVCPSCGQETYTKLLSVAGFQLKGAGWYETDFKGGGCPSSAASDENALSAGGCCGGNCACHSS